MYEENQMKQPYMPNAVLGGAMGLANQAQSQKPRMDVALDDLGRAIEQLGVMASHVAGRVERVSRPQAPEPATNTLAGKAGQGIGGAVVTQLDGMTERIRQIGAQLQGTLNRLEV